MDKDGLTKNLPPPTIKFFKIPKPTKDELLTTIYDFWFEMAGVAKYLARKDIFFAKKIDNGHRQRLIVANDHMECASKK